MSNLTKGTALRKERFGLKVDRTAAVLPTAQAALFTVAGGRVIVTGLVGECTTVCDGTATTLKITGNPTVGTDVDWSSTTAITSKEVGALVGLPLTFGGALNVQNAGGAELPGALSFVGAIGTIDVVPSATNTGAFKWTLFYIPLDDAASVTAA
jgi:hypothetical protein